MTRKEEIQEKSENELGSIDYQVGFSQGAQWADETMIEKAIGWIDYNNRNGGCNFNEWEKDFKQAMMEE